MWKPTCFVLQSHLNLLRAENSRFYGQNIPFHMFINMHLSSPMSHQFFHSQPQSSLHHREGQSCLEKGRHNEDKWIIVDNCFDIIFPAKCKYIYYRVFFLKTHFWVTLHNGSYIFILKIFGTWIYTYKHILCIYRYILIHSKIYKIYN